MLLIHIQILYYYMKLNAHIFNCILVSYFPVGHHLVFSLYTLSFNTFLDENNF